MRQLQMSKLIHEQADINPRVVVFTQNIHQIQQFLFEESGKWNVKRNRMFWPEIKNIKPKKILFVESFDSFNQPEIGLDTEASRIIFTKNVFFPVKKEDFVIMDHFDFPNIHINENISYLQFISTHKSSYIKTNSKQHLWKMHDMLTFHGINHSIDEAIKAEIHISDALAYSTHHDALLIYGIEHIQNMMCAHQFKTIYVDANMRIYSMDFKDMKEIERLFLENNDCGMDLNYLSYRLGGNPTTLKRLLDFMFHCGTLAKAYPDDQHLTLQKIEKNEDLFYQYIPEGTFAIRKLMKHLKCKREEVFPILKKYNVRISFAPQSEREMFVLNSELNIEKFNQVLAWLNKTNLILSELATNATRWINSYLVSKIEKHCLTFQSTAMLFRDGATETINPNGQILF